MLEKDLFDSITNAEIYFMNAYGHRVEASKNIKVFPRWVSIHFGIELEFNFDILFNNLQVKTHNPRCDWNIIKCRSEENAILFKLRF